MTPDDVIDVLAKAAAFDQRTVGQADVMAWHEVLHRIDRDDALAAVTRHYSETRERLMPADVLKHSRAVREARERRERVSAPLTLPSRYEDDPDRDFRFEQGMSQVKPILQAIAERRKRERVSA